jgi:putative ABC transport system permease protein
MLRNYFRIAHRTLLKNKVFSFINIFGLAVGMAAFLFIIQYVRFERSYEQFNPNAENIYRITLDLYNGSEYVVTDCETHAPMGPLLTEKMPEVLDYARMFHNDGFQDVEVGDQKFLEEGIYFADTSAFRMFSLGVVQGEECAALSNPFQTVITASTAKKYFGRTDVVGEAIKIENRLYHITAVIADLPPNTHLKFNILLSHSTLEKIYEWYTKYPWGGNNEYTYLLMAPGTDLAAFNKKLTALCASMKDQVEDDRYAAEALEDIHLYSNKTFEPEVNGNARVVYFLLIIAVFIIVIAWVNYVNLSTARAIERAREVGIRKVMGSLKVQLVFQFLSESVMVNLIAAALAFGLFQMGLPFFRELTGQPLSLNIVTEPSFWSLFLLLFLTGSVLSGLYPALVLSSFQPSTVLKGKFKSSSHGQQLRKGLVVFQFAATVILMICMCTVYLQINHMRTHDLGMTIDQTLVLRAPRLTVPDSAYQAVFESGFRSFKTELLRHQEIQLVARSESVPGLSLHELSTTSNVKQVGKEKSGGSYNYYSYSVDADFIPALNMKLIAGRNFEAGIPNPNMVIINEDAVSKLGFSSVEEALGSKLTYSTWGDGKPSTVIGVLRNFYQRSPKEPHIPMILKYRERADYFSIRMKTGQTHETLATVKTVWDEVFPGSVFHYFFLDENYNQQYQADARFGRVVGTFSGLAVFIACLGLFGLSSFTIIQRTKEIGIRKVLGASVGQIVRLLSQDFVKVVMLAAFLALPVAYFAMEEWLSGYAVRIDLSGWIFAFPVIMILLIALLTVSVQTIKTALANPVDSLKQE